MSTDRREHHARLHHHIWQDSPHFKTLLFLSVGLSVSVLAGRAARYAQIYASEREQREKVETAVRMRGEILNLATHDLRSPATSVLSRARLVQHRLQGV